MIETFADVDTPDPDTNIVYWSVEACRCSARGIEQLSIHWSLLPLNTRRLGLHMSACLLANWDDLVIGQLLTVFIGHLMLNWNVELKFWIKKLNWNVELKCWIEMLNWNVELKCWIEMLNWNMKLKSWSEMLKWNIYLMFNIVHLYCWRITFYFTFVLQFWLNNSKIHKWTTYVNGDNNPQLAL